MNESQRKYLLENTIMGNYITAIKMEVTTSGFKIRMVARLDMLISIGLMLLYTYWLFQLPRDWEPTLEQQGPLYPKQCECST
ncbi:unnamed protein product [Allacma fusca]|uniref:Uncharacterized protein n=1 Tax=Allacma fusca TaxID=39272 RepID=A0A8J2JLH1_9HEXA|nr:unnamed protein product [Allacma fusca]